MSDVQGVVIADEKGTLLVDTLRPSRDQAWLWLSKTLGYSAGKLRAMGYRAKDVVCKVAKPKKA